MVIGIDIRWLGFEGSGLYIYLSITGHIIYPPPGQIKYPLLGPSYLPSLAVNLNL